MKKVNIIKKSQDFDRIIHSKKSFKYKYYIIYIEYNEEDTYRFGLSVGKKIGNAVERNKKKRQLKSIIDQKEYKNGFNCIIIVDKGIKEKKYIEMNKDFLEAIKPLNIIKEQTNEKK